jgi:hypothetical protein
MPSSKRAGAPFGAPFIRLCLALIVAVIGAPFLLASSSSAAPDDKVVVCKYVSTQGGVLDHIVIVSENTLGNANQPFNGVLPFIWTDAQGQTEVGSIAIRYAEEGEQAQDVDPSECVQAPPDECEELPGDQPEGFQCEPITETETRDVGPTLDCDAGTITTLHQERTRTQVFVADPPPGAWVFEDWSDWVTVDQTVEQATEDDCPGEPIDPPAPNPPNPPAPVDPPNPTLPDTGAEDYLGGLALLSGLILAGASALIWRSRRMGLPQL